MDLPKNLQHIIFDLGGIVVDLSGTDVVTMLRRGLAELNYVTQEVSSEAVLEAYYPYERGETTYTHFRDELKRLLNVSCTDEVIDRGWNSIIVRLPKHRVAFIQKLRKHYRVSCLSNTCDSHISYVDTLAQEHGLTQLRDLFDTAYYSYELGMRKPDPAIYLHAIQDSGIDAAHTLFIDDSEANVRAAREVGLEALLLVGAEIDEELGSLIP